MIRLQAVVRCPSCDAEIAQPATFCGRCGTRVGAQAASGLGTATLGALVAPGPRRAKVAGLLIVDAVLLGLGSWFILQYFGAARHAHAIEPAVQAPPAAPVAPSAPAVVPAPEPAPLAQELPPPPPARNPAFSKGPRKRVARVRPVAVHTPKAVKPVSPPPAPPPGVAAPPAPPPAPAGPAVPPAEAPPPSGPPPEPVPEAAPSPEEDGVRFVVQHHLPQVQACYERALKLAPGLRGLIDLQFTVQPDGSAVDAHAVQNSTGSEELAGCLARTVESWTFPRPVAGPVDFVYPFHFAGSGP